MVETQRTVDTPQGPITYTLTVKSVKNMNLRLEGDGTVRVSVNRRVPYAAADTFVRSRAAWIGRGRERLAQRGAPIPPPDREEALQSLTRALDRVVREGDFAQRRYEKFRGMGSPRSRKEGL